MRENVRADPAWNVGDHINPLANQIVAQLDLEQVALRLFSAVQDGIDDDLVSKLLKKAAGPRAVRADFVGNLRAGILLREPPQGFAVLDDRALVNDFPLRVQPSDRVLLVAEIETNGEGRYGVFHGSCECITASCAARCLLI